MDFPAKSNCLSPPDTAALVPTEGNKVTTAGASNVLLARTRTGVSLTQDTQVPLTHVRELQLYLQPAWPSASLSGRERQAERLGSHMWRGVGMGVSLVGAGRVKNTMG